MAKIAVLGYGTVGSGTVEVFYKNKEALEKKAGMELDIKYILELRGCLDDRYTDKFIKDFDLILNDDEVGIVAELIGGATFAYDYVKKALLAGKSVVTSNKELVAKKGAELLTIAREKGVNFFFEASVGGGIPIIRPIHQCLSANSIDEIAGILNGTTNYILTKMLSEGMSFEDALKKAQELGYAERNPAADVEGHDTCRKICILASLSFGKHIYPESVYTEGITNITLEDAAYCESNGSALKLIGLAKKLDEKVEIMVFPAFVDEKSQLGTVNDVFNAILVKGDATGEVVFYGKGAGKLPTASAVVSDIVDAAKSHGNSKSLFWTDSEQSFVLKREEVTNAFYIRFTSENIEKAVKLVPEIFGKVDFLSRKEQPANEAAFITGRINEGEFDAMCEKFAVSSNIVGKIRVLDY